MERHTQEWERRMGRSMYCIIVINKIIIRSVSFFSPVCRHHPHDSSSWLTLPSSLQTPSHISHSSFTMILLLLIIAQFFHCQIHPQFVAALVSFVSLSATTSVSHGLFSTTHNQLILRMLKTSRRVRLGRILSKKIISPWHLVAHFQPLPLTTTHKI